MSYRRIPTDEQWASERLSGVPLHWRNRITHEWRDLRALHQIDARRTANLFLLNITERLNALRLPLNADDNLIRDTAKKKALECLGVASVFVDVKERRKLLERMVRRFNCDPPKPMRVTRNGTIVGVRDQPAILRMTCAKWWRKAIRVMHRKFFEAAAMQLGFINAKMGSYVSNESLKRRVQQCKRTQRMLERTVATNEEGACFSLADLRSRSVSNPAIKRGELMTRINGCEAIARELGHIGLFLTMTCPSRMHKFTKGKRSNRSNGRWCVKGVRENPRYDGTLPNEAQSYLSSMFARLRAFLGNHGVKWYGFRIAEPNHDGTPHWHFLVFFDPALFRCRKGVRAPGQRGRVKDVFVRDERAALLPRLCAWIRRYALEDSPDEPGAKHHRVDFKVIDWKRGTAAGYIAKYVAKNIDGYGVQDDMFGNAGLETAMRVDAWASTWGIRQFQPIGGPPVTVWREARRLDKVPDGAPSVLDEMYEAVNKIQYSDGEVESASWAKYVKSNGGMLCPRDARPVQIYREYDERLGQYGEPVGDCVKGLEARGIRYEQDGIVLREKFVSMVVRTNRHTWTIAPRMPSDAEIDLTRHSSRKSWELRMGLAREARPWTRVNNCTQSPTPESSDVDDWIADYDHADSAERAGSVAAATNSLRTSEVADGAAHSDLSTGPAARDVEQIHVSPDDVRDWLADYTLAEARGRPSIWARAKLSEVP